VHKFIVIYFDDGVLTVAGYEDELPKGYVRESKNVYAPKDGGLADGVPYYLEMPSHKYDEEG
jgi:hypothetical protein